jgi:hypothetical protein
LLPIALALILSITEQEFDEAAAHRGAFGGRRPHRRNRPLRGLINVDHGGFGDSRGVDRDGRLKSGAKTGHAGEKRKRHIFEHRRTLYCFVTVSSWSARSAPLHATS